MSDPDLVLYGNVVMPDRVINDGYVAISGEKIAAVGNDKPPAARELKNFEGHWIIPGVIDGQVHSSSQAGQEGIGTCSRAAAAGGVTVMVDMPYDDPQPVTNSKLFGEKVATVQHDAYVDVALYATIAPENGLDAIPGLVDSGACAFKFSTFEANRQRFPRIKDDTLYEAFRRLAPTGLMCGVHNQDQEIALRNIDRLVAAGDDNADAFGRANTPLVENLATARVYELGAETGGWAHAVHVSLSRGFDICNLYKRAGYKATIESCVQYLMLNEEEHVHRLGAKVKHYPPIRPKAETELLWSHIAAGHCNFVSSDHVAWGLERKNDPNIFKNASGGPGIETLLPAMWTGCEEHGLSPTTVVDLLCKGPSKAFQLPGKGRLDVGADADVAVLEPGQFIYDPSKSLSAVNWSSFEGREFTVRVAATFVRGKQVWNGSTICNEAGDGQFIRPIL